MKKAPEGLCFRFLIGEYHTTETIGESQLLGSLFTGWQGVVAQMPVAAEVGSGDERDELGSG